MVTIISGRHVEITDNMRGYIEKKIARLNKYFDRISEMEVIVEKEGIGHKVELIIRADRTNPFIVHHRNSDMYNCLDICLDKVERQMTRLKDKIRNRKGRPSFSGQEIPPQAIQPEEEEA